MTVPEFLIAMALGAGAIALWINARWPGLAPERLWTVVIHVGVAMLIGMAVVPAVDELVSGSVSPLVRAILITFIIGLPALVYSLLTSIWVILMAQGAMRRHR